MRDAVRAIKGYYFIADKGLTKRGVMNDVKDAISAGVTAVQYRNKDGRAKEMLNDALAIAELCRGRALFIVNDRLDVAIAADADGVHIGKDDMPYVEARAILGNTKIIGVSVDNIEAAFEAEKNGADYIGVGPVFATSTKKDAGRPTGVFLIREIKKICGIPVVAIGGITAGNARETIDAGADAICAISAVLAKDDVFSEIKKLQGLFTRG